MVKVSAPGKCILIGEHAVVYGEPAIIAAIGKRTTVQCTKSDKVRYLDRRFDTEGNVWSITEVLNAAKNTMDIWSACAVQKDFSKLFEHVKKNKYENYRKTVIGIVLQKLGIKEGVSVEISSDVPVGSGLGSSSSLSVALAKCIAETFGKRLDLSEINSIAYELEKIIHGTPSGGDNSASCYGGLLWFKRGESGNTIKSLKEEIPQKLENFVLVYTGQPEKTTGELVQSVRNIPEAVRNKHIKAIGEASLKMRAALAKKDMITVRDCMNTAQENLAALGVSTPAIDKIAKAMRNIAGAGKLCGAGGGGIMLCYHHDKKKLVSVINNLGYEPIEVELAVEGVRIE